MFVVNHVEVRMFFHFPEFWKNIPEVHSAHSWNNFSNSPKHEEILTLVTRPYSVKDMRTRIVEIVWLSVYPWSSYCAADDVYLNCLCSFCCEPFLYLFASTYAYHRYDIWPFLKQPWFLFLHLNKIKHFYNCVMAGPHSNFWLLCKSLRGFCFLPARCQRSVLSFPYFSDGVSGEPSTTPDWMWHLAIDDHFPRDLRSRCI